MSMSTSSILIYQGLRCTKVPRHSNIAVPSVSPVGFGSSWTSAASPTSVTTPDPAASTETSSAIESSASNTWHPAALAPPASTDAATTKPSRPAIAEPVAASSTASTVLGTPSAFRLSHTENGPHHMPVSSTRATTHELQPSTSASSTPLLVSVAPETTEPSTSLTSASPSTDYFVAESTTAHAVASNNSSSHGLIDKSNSGGTSASLRTIWGSVLGGVAFVALALAIGYYLLRHKRRNPRGGLSSGTSEEHLQDGRPEPTASSGGSHQGYQSRGSFLSDASSTHSFPSHIEVPVTKPEETYHPPSRLSPIPEPNPFTDTAEIKYVSRASVASLAGVLRDPFTDPVQNHGTATMRQSMMSQRPRSVAWNSMYSDLSLGSTLILPGRSSAGSSLQRLSYPFTVAGLETCDPSSPVARLSTRSDPFDLEFPPHAMHRRSSTTIPLAQV
ncbi:hypothetical protein BO71DRAFT_204443 [Aspergillus ellipticus CBS 707.79]|uniref:Uncharacterized protein n=1 Tax=Aspergillus ellipticus CBS 707.79 TaxID=1448320 RepID=A0A319DDE3_9EURO|nr:hypothetical protein BO71DRAFT_204443 [Aspergillus ellipticus CBS 707.79]